MCVCVLCARVVCVTMCGNIQGVLSEAEPGLHGPVPDGLRRHPEGQSLDRTAPGPQWSRVRLPTDPRVPSASISFCTFTSHLWRPLASLHMPCCSSFCCLGARSAGMLTCALLCPRPNLAVSPRPTLLSSRSCRLARALSVHSYYYNSATKESSWTIPPEFQEATAQPAATGAGGNLSYDEMVMQVRSSCCFGRALLRCSVAPLLRCSRRRVSIANPAI